MIVAFKLSTTNNYTAFPGGFLAANTTNFTAANATAFGYALVPGKTYQFIIVAYVSDELLSQSSAVTVVLPELNPPINLRATNITATSVELRWKDNSSNEVNYFVGQRAGTNGNFGLASGGVLPPNTTNFTVTGLLPATTYQFLIENYRDDYTVADSTNITVNTLNAFLSRSFHPAVVGQSFTYTLSATTNRGAPTNYTVLGALPPGLGYNPTNRQILGIPAQAGVFTNVLVAQYATNGAISNTFIFRIIHPAAAPLLLGAIPAQTLTNGGAATNLPLHGLFVDRDTEKAVRFSTSKGDIDVALYATATPQTVSNFLNYVNRGDYSDSVIHRSAPNFVVQGGGFRPNDPQFTSIMTDPSPTNEPGIAPLRGTVAMAKVGGNPNSATSQWFFNVGNNTGLDDQNGGFTAFGRICGAGLGVVDAINLLPIGDYTVTIDGVLNSTIFNECPQDTPPPAPDPVDFSKLVLVNSVTPIAALTYSVTGNSVTGVVTASISGSNLVLTPLPGFGGTTTVSVAATDLDGNATGHQFNVLVHSPFTGWQSQFALVGASALPTADPDGDGVTNAVEFALGGSPTASDAASTRPTRSLVTVGPDKYLALTFKLRKDLSGALVRLRAASAVNSGYTEIWNSAGVGAGLVVQQPEADANYWLITVRDNTPVTAGSGQRFLHLQVIAP
jgi:cyclophilin family peptidyl-prolyl cis-trans isomerase